jgi:uncharacterized protein (DUF1810 family)
MLTGPSARSVRPVDVTDDPYNLQRFVVAQSTVLPQVLAELRNGRKTTHWMWYVFPQLRGLGRSSMAQKFAISSLEEARAYLDHPLLGPRIKECARLVVQVEGRSIEDIFGDPDYRKFRSSMTLFARATVDNGVFLDALKKYFGGERDDDSSGTSGA